MRLDLDHLPGDWPHYFHYWTACLATATHFARMGCRLTPLAIATALLQVNSLEEMDAKIDSMARSGALDPALLLTLAQAHTSVKDTDYTRAEVKDVMAHLYFKVSPTCNGAH